MKQLAHESRLLMRVPRPFSLSAGYDEGAPKLLY
jgi:hypothetical protein